MACSKCNPSNWLFAFIGLSFPSVVSRYRVCFFTIPWSSLLQKTAGREQTRLSKCLTFVRLMIHRRTLLVVASGSGRREDRIWLVRPEGGLSLSCPFLSSCCDARHRGERAVWIGIKLLVPWSLRVWNGVLGRSCLLPRPIYVWSFAVSYLEFN